MSVSRGEYEKLFDSLLTDGLPSLIAAAHELKSPLSLIRQLALMLDYENINLCDKKRIIKQIELTSERGLRLTSDLTRSIRLDDALFKLEPINPKQICEDIIHEINPLYTAHNKKIELSNYKRSPLMIANRDLIRRIILNFCDNALNYSDTELPVKIRIKSLNNGNVIRLGVRDFGPNLPKNLIKNVPKRLKEAPSPIFARPQSSGLGLYIAGQFADLMNGKVGMLRHSDGTTFYVDLQASRQLSLL